MKSLRLDSSQVDPFAVEAWSVHIGSPVDDPEALRRRLGEGTLPEAFAASARRNGPKTALALPDGSVTYAQLDLACGRMARELGRMGAGAGDVILVVAETATRTVVAYLAALRVGATVVLANPTFTTSELTRLGNESQAKLAIAGGASLSRLSVAGLGVSELVGMEPDDGQIASVLMHDLAGDPAPVIPLDPNSAALYAYTSATTGTAKCVPLSHRNLLASIRGVMWAWRWTSSDVLIHALPLAHQHGLGGIHATLLAGSSANLFDRFDAEALIRAIETGEPTVLFGVPAMYRKLVDDLGDRLRSFGRLRLLTSGSAALPVELAEAVAQAIGAIPLERYGSTEAGLDVSNPYTGPRVAGTVGLPLPGIEIAVVDAQGARLGGGEAGEVLVRGPQVFSGYRAQPSDESFLHDWFRTGDTGVLDGESGYLRLIGRSKDVIVTGGMNVYPKEVESVLGTVSGLSDVAVIGVPSERWGEEVIAFVVAPKASTQDVMKAARHALAPYKRPKRVVFVAAIPRNEVGKVQRDRLLKLDDVRSDGTMEYDISSAQ